MAGSLEIRLFNFIKELHKEIVDMKPEGGFSSPRDYELVTEVNKKAAILDKLQEAMRVYNPDFEYEPKEERHNVLDKKFTRSDELIEFENNEKGLVSSINESSSSVVILGKGNNIKEGMLCNKSNE